MTEKELRKLSRLDILELLLEQTKINEQLRAEIDRIQGSDSEFNSIENLQKLNSQLSSALAYTDSLTKKAQKSTSSQDRKSDKYIYSRIMYFYLKNDAAMSALPPDLQEDIRERLRKVINECK
ncbi:MAG: hypothetical protein IJZ35_07215 [Clostridia bacterium]|nr:hypothetical protein [Clostridia bacterium]